MRLWSIHPKYLDSKGLVALWREGLLAKKVLEGKTIGYRQHSQLRRFKKATKTLEKINLYLHIICDEADARGYHFDRTKLRRRRPINEKMRVTRGQVEFEWKHLKKKCFKRCRAFYFKLTLVKTPQPHPLFRLVKGEVEEWEVQS